jgi:hypothetical protein
VNNSHPEPEVQIILAPTQPAPDGVTVHRIFAGVVYAPEESEHLVRLTALWQVLVDEERLKPNPVKVRPSPGLTRHHELRMSAAGHARWAEFD